MGPFGNPKGPIDYHMQRKLTDKLVLSNLAFLVPFGAAFYFHLFLHTAIVGLCFVFSLLNHFYKEQKLEKADTLFAYLLILSNSILCFSAGFPGLFYSVMLPLIIISLSLYYLSKKRHYERFHSWWHLLSAAITLASVMLVS